MRTGEIVDNKMDAETEKALAALAAASSASTCSARGLFSYPVPLDGVDAHVMVPKDLNSAEAARIYRVLLSLCVDSPNDKAEGQPPLTL